MPIDWTCPRLRFQAKLAVKLEGDIPTVFPAKSVSAEDNMLQVCVSWHMRCRALLFLMFFYVSILKVEM